MRLVGENFGRIEGRLPRSLDALVGRTINKDKDMNLMQGDCLERMKEIPDGSVDMVLTDIVA